MTIPVTCPGCDAPFDVPAKLAGKTIRCTNCKSQMAVPSPRKAAAQGIEEPLPIPLDDLDDAPKPRKKVRVVEEVDDDEDYDDRPRGKKNGGSSGKVGLMVGGGVLGVLLLAGAGVGIYYATKGPTVWVDVPDAEANGFTAKMPGIPSTDLKAAGMDDLVGKDGKFYVYKTGNDTGFVAGYLKMPAAVPAAMQPMILANMSAEMKKTTKGGGVFGKKAEAQLDSDAEITQDGFRGREFHFSAKPPFRGTAVMRMILAEDRMFMAIAAVAPSEADRITTFFDSFKITLKKSEDSKAAETAAPVAKKTNPGKTNPPAADVSASWQAIPNPEAAGYFIKMPGTPTTNLPPAFQAGYASKTGGASLSTAYCFMRGNFETYFAGYNVLPAAPDPSLVQPMLVQMGAKLKNTGSKLGTHDKPITQDGYPGREVVVSHGAGLARRYEVYRLVLAHDRLFIVFANGDSFRSTTDPRFQTYFDSFKITYQPAGSPPKPSEPLVQVPPATTPDVPDYDPKGPEWQPIPKPVVLTAEMPGRSSYTSRKINNVTRYASWGYTRPKETYQLELFHKTLDHPAAASVAAAMKVVRENPLTFITAEELAQAKESDYRLGSYSGKELRYDSQDGSHIVVIRFLQTNARVFIIVGAVKDAPTNGPRLKRFLDSVSPVVVEKAKPAEPIAQAPPATPSSDAATVPPAGNPPPPNNMAIRRTRPGRVIVPARPAPAPGAVAAPADSGDLKLAAKIDPFWAVAFAPSRGEVFTIGRRPLGAGAAGKNAGMLRRYSYPDFKLKGTYQLPNLAAKAVYDDKTGTLTVAALSTASAALLVRTNAAFERSFGDAVLQQFDLNPVFDGTVAERDDLKPSGAMPSFGKPVALELSADGKALYCLAETLSAGNTGSPKAKLLHIDPATRKVVREMPLPEPTRDMSWSADGKTLYLTEWPVGPKNVPLPDKAVGVATVDADAWTRGPTIPLPGITNDVSASPAGKSIATVAAPGRNKLYILDAAGGPPQELTEAPGFFSNNGYARFTPDGKRLLVSSVGTQMGVDLYDVTDAAAATGYRRTASALPTDAKPLTGYFRLTPDGAMALFNTGAVLDLGK